MEGLGSELANSTKEALKNIPRGLKARGADYPVLRVFASWPGEAKLERTDEWPGDADKHPLACLHLENFEEVGYKLDADWFRRDLLEKVISSKEKVISPKEKVTSSKHVREEEEEDSDLPRRLRPLKRARLVDAKCVTMNPIPTILTPAQTAFCEQLTKPSPDYTLVFLLVYSEPCSTFNRLRVCICTSLGVLKFRDWC